MIHCNPSDHTRRPRTQSPGPLSTRLLSKVRRRRQVAESWVLAAGGRGWYPTEPRRTERGARRSQRLQSQTLPQSPQHFGCWGVVQFDGQPRNPRLLLQLPPSPRTWSQREKHPRHSSEVTECGWLETSTSTWTTTCLQCCCSGGRLTQSVRSAAASTCLTQHQQQ